MVAIKAQPERRFEDGQEKATHGVVIGKLPSLLLATDRQSFTTGRRSSSRSGSPSKRRQISITPARLEGSSVNAGSVARAVSKTALDEALAGLEEVFGDLAEEEVAHSFQEGHAIEVGDRILRYISPADIQDDENLRVVFFKLSLNTGWDCPRAEVIMSFRRALDYTRIAQLVGRLVRTPLARRILANDFLNGVSSRVA